MLENGVTFKFVPDCYKNRKMRNKAVDNYPHALEFVPDWNMTQNMFPKVVSTNLSTNEYVSDQFKT